MLLGVAESRLEAVLQLIQNTAEESGLSHRFVPEDVLVDAGMTSLAMVDLMFAIEARFDITIPDIELTITNFRNGACIAEMIERVIS